PARHVARLGGVERAGTHEPAQLNPTERLALVDQVLHSRDEPDPTIDRIWIEEAERRLVEYRAGKA
ncbi:MAG: addiction module protein, partial [Burkholderiales bacterium]